MKTLLFNTVILVFVLCSCTGNKSFTHQRYTSFGHKKQHEAASRQSSVARVQPAVINANPAVSNEPSTVVVPQSEMKAQLVTNPKTNEIKTQESPVLLTASAGSAKMIKTASAPKVLNSNLVSHASKALTKQVSKASAKHGLLFGVIDALLSIILIVVVVAVVVFLILVLI